MLRLTSAPKLKRTLYGKFHQHLDARFQTSSLSDHFVPEAAVQLDLPFDSRQVAIMKSFFL
jgi:hypothetical protein